MSEQRAERFVALDRQLEAAVERAGERGASVVVGESEPVDLPPDSLKTLHKVVHALAAGSEPMLTTTEAADFLGVSRPYLTRLLKSGKLPYRKKGNRHLVPLTSVEAFKTERDHKLDELTALAAAEEHLGIR
ncbi:MAG TPA: helix-turn-helix domain-containing protein [Egibacteraceae bacterium]|nr:helix-turn-helix domain-containing protein [Egibacteraceae bacterium]